MSITDLSHEPSQVRPPKALSWHHTNREYHKILLVENARRQQEHAIRTILEHQKEETHLDGFDDMERHPSVRTRLSRRDSFTSANSRTKTNTGLIHTTFREYEQILRNQNHIFTSKFCNIQRKHQAATMGLQSFGKAVKDSLADAVAAVEEATESGTKSPSGKRRVAQQNVRPSSVMEHATANPAKKPKSPKTSIKATKATKTPQSSSAAAEPAANPASAANPTNTQPPASSSKQQSEITTDEKARDAWQEAGAPRIPARLSNEEREVYNQLIKIRYSRINGPNRGSRAIHPTQVVVITDLGKDYDDLTAMVVLKELHRLGLIRLLGFIANLHPPKDRARFGRGCLDSLGLQDVPIAWGEEAQANPSKRTDPKHYEFPHTEAYFRGIWGNDPVFTPYDQDKSSPAEIESGVKLLDRLVKERIEARDRDPRAQKLTFLLISSLSDIATYAKREPELLATVTERVVLQGDYSIQQGPYSYHAILTPNMKAANNGFDPHATKEFHEYLDNHHIPSFVYTKWAATKASLPSRVFKEMSSTNQIAGVHLNTIQEIQDLEYYENACNPETRFMEHMDQKWFLEGKTNWYQKHPPGDPTPLPVGREVLPYVQLVCYDALAALGTAGDDVLEELQVLKPRTPFENQGPHIHKIVGKEEIKASKGVQAVPADSGLNEDRMKLVLTALLKGSMLALEEGIPSTHTTRHLWRQGNAAAEQQDLLVRESAAFGGKGGRR